MALALKSALLALLPLFVACKKVEPSAASNGSAALPSSAMLPSSAIPRVVVSAQLSSASAFDLAVAPDGLRLWWASAANEAGWLSDVALGPDGRPRGTPRRSPVPARSLGKVTDLSVSFVAEQATLAWLEQGPTEARALAALLGGTASVLDLGPAALVAEAARGNIAVAPEPEKLRALVMWRGLEVPCVDVKVQGPCTGFTFRRVQAGAVEPTGLPLSVPVPCTSHSVELATTSERFFYGVCTREGSDPVTTMFSIQYSPEYARAEPLLKGCLPLGTIEVAGRPWLLGDCHGKRRATPVPLSDEKVQVEDISAPEMTCTPLRAELRQGKFELELREPRAGLQGVLPATLLPTGARAAWTGSSLVVAYLNGPRLETQAYGCNAGKLEPLP